jgi:hypothetical protein
MVYGLWFMVYGLWFMVYGLGLELKGSNQAHFRRHASARHEHRAVASVLHV